VTAAGDLNGDGYGDVIVTGNAGVWVSSSSYQLVGEVYEFLGGPAGLASSPAAKIATTTSGDFATVGTGTDVDGNGYADVVVGYQGTAFAYFGGPGGLTTTPSITFDVPVGTSGAYDYRVTSVGDLNGDGYGDFLASYDTVYVYLGSPSGPSVDPTETVHALARLPGDTWVLPVCARGRQWRRVR
jgi:hypothetical protein